MKVLDSFDADEKLNRRILAIERDLLSLRNEIEGATSTIIAAMSADDSLPAIDRHRFLVSMSAVAHMALDFQNASLKALKKRELRNVGLPYFPSLPAELRLQVWRYAMESELEPRVHCIDRLKGRFVSNQSISPLLGINSESRAYFLNNTRASFAFETYINFEIDVVYIPFFRSRDDIVYPRVNDDADDESAEENEEPEADEGAHADNQIPFEDDPTLVAFLENPSSAKIKNLAMRHEFEKHIPLRGHMSESHARMRLSMPAWCKTYIVFEDFREREEKWLDINVSFKELSARQKRARAERGYARQHAKVLNRMMDVMEDLELEEMQYSFCFVTPGSEVAVAESWHGLD